MGWSKYPVIHSDIPETDWSKYPETKPTKSGYYYTLYHNVDEDEHYYKCLCWDNVNQNWLTWRNSDGTPKATYIIERFIEETRTDYYCPCCEKVERTYSRIPYEN
jgi:hypothetical protein